MSYVSWTSRITTTVERNEDGRLEMVPYVPGEKLEELDSRLKSTKALVGERYETMVNVYVAVYECSGRQGGSGDVVGWEEWELYCALSEVVNRMKEKLEGGEDS